MKVEAQNEPDFALLTQTFIERADDSDTKDRLVKHDGLSLPDAIAWTVQVQANGCVRPASGHGQEAEGLSRWHRNVAKSCSDTYAELRAKHPEMTRAEINEMPELSLLNAVRRGVRSAMRTSYGHAGGTRFEYGHRLFPE